MEDKEGRSGKVQAGIKRFLEPNKQPFGASGTCCRARPTGTSRLDPGTSPPVGGKDGEARIETRIGSIGSWKGRTKSFSSGYGLLSTAGTGGERKDESGLDLHNRGEEGKKTDLIGVKGNLEGNGKEPELGVEIEETKHHRIEKLKKLSRFPRDHPCE